MKGLGVILLAGCALAAGCGDDSSSPASPSSAPVVFAAQLSPANEVPAVSNAEGGAAGAVQITFVPTGDGGATASFHIQLTNMALGTRIVGAHIHPGVPGVNGSVAVGTGVSGASPFEVDAPITEFRAENINVVAATAQSIINNPGAFYFNVHSTLNPGGFARGQLVRIR
jgi:hypothetical protein